MNRLVIIALLAVAACSRGNSQQPPPAAAQTAKPPIAAADVITVAPAASASYLTLANVVAGTVTVEGQVPAVEPITVADKFCGPAAEGLTTESLVADTDGGLKNAFVYVKRGLEGQTFPRPASPVVLEMKGCRFVPRVLGVRVNQTLEVLNSDLTLHWVRNKTINVALAIQGLRFAHSFDFPEVMVPVTDPVHPWMSASIGVLDHPFFAVSDDSGRFEIRRLPPGTYLLEAWHEKLGTQTQVVTVWRGRTTVVRFTFNITPD